MSKFIAAQLEIEHGRIVAILPHHTHTPDFDYENLRILPGFIDIHTHGGYGFDTNDGNPEGLRHWLSQLPAEGVTGVLPTTITQTPEILGAALELGQIPSEIIADGRHVSFPGLRLFFQCLNNLSPILITDSIRSKGLKAGNYRSGGLEIEQKANGCAYLKNTQTLAGSTLKMNEGLKNLIEHAQIPIQAAIHSCTLNPAHLLKLDSKKGKLLAGYDADLVVLNDDYSVENTIIEGQVYKY